MSSAPLPSSFDGNTEFYEENRWQKLTRRLKEEPLIPLGCLLTCMALVGAARSVRAGDHNRTQRMFRARILAQGFTLVAMVAGSMYWETDRKKRKEFDALVAERKAKEKNELWIKELEARDEEEKEYKAARERRRNGGVMEQRGVMDIVAEKTRETAEKSVGKPASGQTATKPVAESEGSKSVLESVQNLVWGGKK